MTTDQLAKPQRAFWSVFTVFLANGALFGTWVSRIPAIQTNLDLSEGDLGLVLVGLSIGVLVALSLAGRVIAALGSRNVTLGGMAAVCLLLPFLALAPHALLLSLVLFLIGGALSGMDVAMNAQAVVVERRAKRPCMSTFHGAFSVGGLLGALLGSAMAALHIPPLPHFCFAALVFGLATAAAARHLLATAPAGATTAKTPVFSFPPRALWPLGAVALISSIAEGAMADWSAVYLTEVLGTTTATAALGFAAYSFTMTVGRLTGDRLKQSWRSVRIVRSGGVLAVAGLLCVVASDSPVLTLFGFAALGLGLANIIPIAFRAAGNFPGIASETGIASVATIGYAGFLAGPPFIGLVAEASSLRLALALIAALLLTLLWIGKAVSTDDPPA